MINPNLTWKHYEQSLETMQNILTFLQGDNSERRDQKINQLKLLQKVAGEAIRAARFAATDRK